MFSGAGTLKLEGKAALVTVSLSAVILAIAAAIPGSSRVGLAAVGWIFALAIFPDGSVPVLPHGIWSDDRGRGYTLFKWLVIIVSTLSFVLSCSGGYLGSIHFPGPTSIWCILSSAIGIGAWMLTIDPSHNEKKKLGYR